jgi:hypothetical protein
MRPLLFALLLVVSGAFLSGCRSACAPPPCGCEYADPVYSGGCGGDSGIGRGGEGAFRRW